MNVEIACARVLLKVERTFSSVRGIIEAMKVKPRGVVLALCLGVLRSYKLLEEALRRCGYRGELRKSTRGWAALVCAYELMHRRESLSLSRRVWCSTLLGEGVAECLKNTSEDDVIKSVEARRKLEVKYSVPRWVIDKISEANPPGGVEEVLKAFQKPSPVWIRYNKSVLDLDEALGELESAGITAEPDPVLDDVVKVVKSRPGALERLNPLKFYVQDRSSALVAHVLSDPGALVLDFFSAPGGKAGHIVWKWGSIVVGLELSKSRLAGEARLLRRHGAWSTILVHCDAMRPPLRKVRGCAVVDPDCSSMGRLGHSPETRLFLEASGPSIVKRLRDLQVAALRRVAEILPRGAVVVYSTCTLTLDENEHVVEKVVSEGLYEPEEASPWIGVKSPRLPRAQRVYPHVSYCAGSFVAKLARV